jgi:adenosylhomocysteine nucleosidase
VASGDEDIVDHKRARELHAQSGALCVAWEGAGGARATYFNRLPYLEIRAITDMADTPSLASFEANLERAMKSLAEVTLSWLPLGPVSAADTAAKPPPS